MTEDTPADPMGEQAPPPLSILQMNVDQVLKQREALEEFIDKCFVEGVHFMKMKRKKGPDTKILLQPGAQELLNAYGLTVNFTPAPGSQLSTDENMIAQLGIRGAYQGEVVRRATGEVITSGVVGECNSFESKYAEKWHETERGKKVPTTPAEKAALANTIMKMGQKRCLVACALLVTGASAIFTQDIEEKHVRDALGIREERGDRGQARTDNPDWVRWPASPKQLELIENLCKKGGANSKMISAFCQEQFGHPFLIAKDGGGWQFTVSSKEAGKIIDAIKAGHIGPSAQPEEEVQQPPVEPEPQGAPTEEFPEMDPTGQALADGFQASPEEPGEPS